MKISTRLGIYLPQKDGKFRTVENNKAIVLKMRAGNESMKKF